ILGVEHVLTRSVRDTAAILDVLAGPADRAFSDSVGADPGRLRVGLMVKAPGGLIPVHADCVAAVERTAQLLTAIGHTVEEAHPPALDEIEHIIHFGAVTGVDAASMLDRWAERTGRAIGPGDVEPNTWMIAEMGRSIGASDLNATSAWLSDYGRRAAAWFDGGYDLLLTPTLPEPPPLLGDLTGTPENPLAAGIRGGVIAVFTPQFNTTGQPAISLPLHWNDAGLPIGVQLVAAYGREDFLIGVAAQLERAHPWADRRPPVSA
ncbi:MAG: amidase, partial [Chloroflexi bacterium]|nr:amidase [Chloroflexota bacterium]